MQLFYSSKITDIATTFVFSKEESKHITKVLRKKEGDTIHITDGRGTLYDATIILANPNKCSIQISHQTVQAAKKYRLHIAVAPTKMNDRFEWFLEKATEIGIDEITPIICDHSERKVIKLERFERIVQSAMKQSLQCYLPTLNPAMTFNDFINQPVAGQLFIAHCETTNKQQLQEVILPEQQYTILIGPEGDFSTNEINQSIAANYRAITLGTNRLRTETAAIVAVHSIALLNT